MNEQDFQNLVRDTNLSQNSREAARLVFVEGWSQTDAGAELGLSKQRMTQIVKVLRTAEQKQKDEADLAALRHGAPIPSSTGHVAALEASYAVAVKAAREAYGDEAYIQTPKVDGKSMGDVIARTDFHLVQSVGRGAVVVHELAKLDRVPAIGKSVAIEYRDGRGTVLDQQRELGRGGRG
ncbi:hypothetical protein LMG19282_01492 [Cupriavidus campinensis]|uniref:TrfB transcriptional repressor protein domain-containing protein n=1 Tax=Cupriavidus campinensis TaxID=151783 RepID=A0ABY3EJ77_9BURK|nr:TrfB-related DNA-binding protein [Cupriavidus campinensis]TSP10981.1 hypothetical protein FGG12_19145 [Cupriavidus campinensis]CAG2138411.1 hypothetical protein LMG19282_01492 [Cupriavidus campinensis]